MIPEIEINTSMVHLDKVQEVIAQPQQQVVVSVPAQFLNVQPQPVQVVLEQLVQ